MNVNVRPFLPPNFLVVLFTTFSPSLFSLVAFLLLHRAGAAKKKENEVGCWLQAHMYNFMISPTEGELTIG